jgi:TRAP-type C4-dicarboxylate transport system permease small subunit
LPPGQGNGAQFAQPNAQEAVSPGKESVPISKVWCRMPGWLETYRKVIDAASKISIMIGQGFAGIMIFLVAADAIGRYVFNRPIIGVLEITELMMLFIVFLAFAYVESENAHVRVDLVISRFPRKIRLYIECLVTLISLGTIGIIAWQAVLYSLELRQQGNLTASLGVPISPFLLVVAFGCLLFCCQLILKLLSFGNQAGRSK